MAHKKGAGSTDNGRDSISKRLGVKVFGGQIAISGNIIVRQRGTRFHPGKGVGMGKDHTIYAVTDGTVVFTKKKNDRTYISVIPVGADMEELLPSKRAQVEVISPEVTEKEIAIAKEGDDESVASISANPEEEKAKEEKPAPKAKKSKGDDLKKIEGIGPKIAGILADAGLDSFKAVAEAGADKIKEILADAGSRYASHDPTTWSEQAALAADGKWDELKKWQDELDGGRA